MKLSDMIRREGDLSSRSGQLSRLYEIAEKVEALEEIAKRYEDAATGECVEAGSMPGMEGDPFVGIIIESTPDELKRGPAIVYKRVRIVLDKEGL